MKFASGITGTTIPEVTGWISTQNQNRLLTVANRRGFCMPFTCCLATMVFFIDADVGDEFCWDVFAISRGENGGAVSNAVAWFDDGGAIGCRYRFLFKSA